MSDTQNHTFVITIRNKSTVRTVRGKWETHGNDSKLTTVEYAAIVFKSIACDPNVHLGSGDKITFTFTQKKTPKPKKPKSARSSKSGKSD
jgi:hypothetical protein